MTVWPLLKKVGRLPDQKRKDLPKIFDQFEIKFDMPTCLKSKNLLLQIFFILDGEHVSITAWQRHKIDHVFSPQKDSSMVY